MGAARTNRKFIGCPHPLESSPATQTAQAPLRRSMVHAIPLCSSARLRFSRSRSSISVVSVARPKILIYHNSIKYNRLGHIHLLQIVQHTFCSCTGSALIACEPAPATPIEPNCRLSLRGSCEARLHDPRCPSPGPHSMTIPLQKTIPQICRALSRRPFTHFKHKQL
jgi:hypothetical protein